jgi:protein-L-isoaspartate(D-aspartate) O-methyltransferase
VDGRCGHYEAVSSGEGADVRLRADMVAHLTGRGGLSSPQVAAALAEVPRHVFVPGVELSEAYADRAVVTRYRDGVPASSASQPAIVAIMLEQLRPPAGGSILEIGAGTGYNAALLSKLVGPSGRVVTVDIDPEVADEARSHLSEAGVANVEVICGDGALGWPSHAPYDGIIVTAGASDLAPAWAGQLAAHGRLVVPLSIRGVQQCVTLLRAGGHLHSVAVCECGFMPLAGSMANADRHQPVPGHPGVYVEAAADTEVDIGVVGRAMDDRGPGAGIGISAPAMEVFGSLRRWLAFHDRAAATLSYTGPAEGADASGVPAVLDFRDGGGGAQRSSPGLLGRAGFAVLDLAGPAATACERVPDTTLELAVRGYGQAGQETARLRELITAWDAAGRPGAGRLRIDAYPAGISPPRTGGSVYPAVHTTFVVSLV